MAKENHLSNTWKEQDWNARKKVEPWEKHWDRPSRMGSVCTYIVFFVHFQQKITSKQASQPERQEHPQNYVNQSLFQLARLIDV